MTPAVRLTPLSNQARGLNGVVAGNSLSESQEDGSALDHLPTPTRCSSDSHDSEGASNYFPSHDLAGGVPWKFIDLWVDEWFEQDKTTNNIKS
jgi:hypothetical protein